MQEKKEKVELILFDSYIQVIKNSVGSRMFKNLIAKVNGKKQDILKNGGLSCAYYASSILCLFKLISDVHATVDGTVRDLEKCGWEKTKKPKVGSVIVWSGRKSGDNRVHKHVGFYLGGHKAISNNTSKHLPAIHSWTFGHLNGKPKRQIESIYWHNKLN